MCKYRVSRTRQILDSLTRSPAQVCLRRIWYENAGTQCRIYEWICPFLYWLDSVFSQMQPNCHT
jgi:hypothetical protein